MLKFLPYVRYGKIMVPSPGRWKRRQRTFTSIRNELNSPVVTCVFVKKEPHGVISNEGANGKLSANEICDRSEDNGVTVCSFQSFIKNKSCPNILIVFFFDSSCPIPATLAPLAPHCLLNQFKMPSFELTFKALQYSVYYFHFLSSLNFSAGICSGSLTSVTCSGFAHTYIMTSYLYFSLL